MSNSNGFEWTVVEPISKTRRGVRQTRVEVPALIGTSYLPGTYEYHVYPGGEFPTFSPPTGYRWGMCGYAGREDEDFVAWSVADAFGVTGPFWFAFRSVD